MKSIIISLLFLVAYSPVYAQTFSYEYTYDASGNRLSRAVVALKSSGGESIYDQTENSLLNDFTPQEQLDDDLANTKITIYPNPTRGELVLKITPINADAGGSILVMDLSGRVVFQTSQILEYNDIDIENIMAGEYILKLIIGQNEKTYKIIKQ